MRLADSLVGRILEHLAAPDAVGAAASLRLEGVPEGQFQWLMTAGLGPLLLHCVKRKPMGVVPSAWHEPLLAADLTAQVRHGNLVETARNVIAVCGRIGAAVVLLKGISTSEALYPAPHLRPMADIDLLVSPDRRRAVESALLAAGYRKLEDYPEKDDQHHGAPLHEPGRNVWTEIHRSLFPEGDEFAAGNLFDTAMVMANSVASTFRGSPVLRLCPELQLVYIATSWMRDITISGMQASFLPSMFDAIYLLQRNGSSFDWQKLERWTDNDLKTASIHVLLSYLASRGMAGVPAPFRISLAARQALVGPLQLRLIHATLDRHLVGGKPWKYVLPPPVAGRYNARRQWIKRMGSARARTR